MKFYKLNLPRQFELSRYYLLINVFVSVVIIILSYFAHAANPSEAAPKEDQGFYGNYQVDGHLMGIDRFVMDGGEKTALISDYTSGVVRRLFRVDEMEFVMGQGFNTQDPPELKVRLIKDGQGTVTGLRIRRTDPRKVRILQLFYYMAQALLRVTASGLIHISFLHWGLPFLFLISEGWGSRRVCV
jgi:hypothetical protein